MEASKSPGPAGEVFLQNYTALLDAEDRAYKWLESVWADVTASIAANPLPAIGGKLWRTEGRADQGVVVRRSTAHTKLAARAYGLIVRLDFVVAETPVVFQIDAYDLRVAFAGGARRRGVQVQVNTSNQPGKRALVSGLSTGFDHRIDELARGVGSPWKHYPSVGNQRVWDTRGASPN